MTLLVVVTGHAEERANRSEEINPTHLRHDFMWRTYTSSIETEAIDTGCAKKAPQNLLPALSTADLGVEVADEA